jgi:hypothetical protein
MKPLSLVILLTFILTTVSRAQDLALNEHPATINKLSAEPGPVSAATAMDPAGPDTQEWQKAEDRILGHIQAGKLAKMKNMAASIISYFQHTCFTEGAGNPVWHGEYFPGANGVSSPRFGVRCIFYNHEDENASTNSDLTVFANDISPLLGRTVVNDKEFITLKIAGAPQKQGSAIEFDMPASVSGNTAAQETEDSRPLHVKAWLITTGSSLPYVPVTRKEYLEEARKELENKKELIIEDDRATVRIRPAAVQEAEKKQMLEELAREYSGTELQARTRIYLQHYMSDEDYVKQADEKNTAGLNFRIRLIDSLLARSTALELAQPAIVSAQADSFEGFEDGRANPTMLVRMKPGYFSSVAEEATPRCLLVCWRYNPADSMAIGIDRQLNENFDGTKLTQSLEE